MFVAGLTSAVAQNPVAFNCTFSVNWYNEYVCRLTGIEVLNRSQQVTFGGEHLDNRTNANVDVVEIRDSNTPFIIPQIFTTFPNIVELEVITSNVQAIEIPDNIQLIELTLSGNNISRIVNETFINQTRLQFFTAVNSGIREIEENAFVGLSSLRGLVLINNNITELAPRTLTPLISAVRIDFERNELTRVEDVFSSCTNLTYLYLEYNQINEISPFFASVTQDSLYSVNLSGNQCVDRFFFFEDEIELIVLNNALSPCFRNFNGNDTETRRITLEFQGPLALFDEFGNIIARVN